MEQNIQKEAEGFKSLQSDLPENIRDSMPKPTGLTPQEELRKAGAFEEGQKLEKQNSSERLAELALQEEQ